MAERIPVPTIPPDGWDFFGTHAGDELNGWRIELSKELDPNDLLPLWERKVSI